MAREFKAVRFFVMMGAAAFVVCAVTMFYTQRATYGRTPAVALTALARSEDRTRALRAAFQLHVAKPVDFTELVAVVQNPAALRDR
jgi:CheY-like chemotaxis protein